MRITSPRNLKTVFSVFGDGARNQTVPEFGDAVRSAEARAGSFVALRSSGERCRSPTSASRGDIGEASRGRFRKFSPIGAYKHNGKLRGRLQRERVENALEPISEVYSDRLLIVRSGEEVNDHQAIGDQAAGDDADKGKQECSKRDASLDSGQKPRQTGKRHRALGMAVLGSFHLQLPEFPAKSFKRRYSVSIAFWARFTMYSPAVPAARNRNP